MSANIESSMESDAQPFRFIYQTADCLFIDAAVMLQRPNDNTVYA